MLVLSGGNIDSNLLSKIIERGLVKDGRMAKLRIELQDSPGQLARYPPLWLPLRANVIEVYHNRSFLNTPMGKTYLDITTGNPWTGSRSGNYLCPESGKL